MADAPSPHGLNSAHHTGTLDNAQIPQALLTDGTRTLTGNLAVSSGITVDGVDISVLKNNYDTHLGDAVAHNYIRNLLDDSDVAAPKGALTNDVKIYGDGTDITVTKTVTGLLVSFIGSGAGGAGTFSGIKDPAGTGVVPDGLAWILTTDDDVVNVAASGANTLAFTVNQANINHGSIGGVTANQHHNQQHVFMTGSGLGPDHTASGLTAGTFLRATSATTMTFGGIAHSETQGQGANDHHNQSHVLATNSALGADHTISGATAGHVLRASSATAAAFAQLALSDLSGAAIGTNLQAWDANLDQIAALTPTDSNIIVGNGSAWVAESGATARTSLGLGTGDSPQFTAVNLGHATDTTIARVSAGLISVEGVTVTLNTATQTLTNKTLTSPVIATIVNTGTLTLPTSTDTLVGRATTDTLTNKTISADSNTLSGIAASSFVLSNASGYVDGSAAQKAIPSGVVVGTTDTQTLTNKTLTAPVIATIVNTGTLTLPTSTDTIVGRATTDTLTNKTISADNNTLSGIAASSFVLSNASGYIDGGAAQKAIPSGVVVGTTDTQTLTNKTLTLPQINDTSSDHQYVFAVSELTADRTVTLPLLTGNDVFVFVAHEQILTNKSFGNHVDMEDTLDVANGFTAGSISSASITPTNLSASRLVSSDGSSKLISVANLASWIAGTTNQLTVTDDLDGSVTLSLPQNIHTAATPTFARMTLSQATGTAPLTISSTTVVSNLNADKADGYDFDQDVRIAGTPQFARLGLGVAAHGSYKLYVLGDSLLDGHIETDSIDVNGAANVYGGDLRVFNSGDFTTPVLYVDESARSIGVNRDPDIQFSVDVAGALRADWLIGPHAIQIDDAEMIVHFDGPGPYETNYTGTSQTHKGKLATLSGDIIYRSGRFGKSLQISEATTNLVTNPSFETSGTDGWTLVDVGSDGSIVRAQSDEQALYGTYSLKLTQTTAGLNEYVSFNVASPAASTTYTVSAWVNVTVFTAGAQSNRWLLIYDTADAGTLGIASITAVTDGWVRLTASVTTTVTPINLQVRLYAPQGTVYWDGVQIEQKSYATPYHDGSLTNPASWSGTAHASTSDRIASTVTYPGVVPRDVYTVFCWFKSTQPSTYNSGSGTFETAIFRIGSTYAGPYSVSVGKLGSSLSTSAYVRNSAGDGWSDTTMQIGASYAAGEWYFVALSYDGTNHTLYVGTQSSPSAEPVWSSDIGASLPDHYGAGSPQDLVLVGANHNDGIDELTVVKRAMPEDEIRSIFESNAPVFAESATAFFKSYGPTPVEINEEGLWVEGPTVGAIFGIYGAASTKSWGGVTLAEGDILIGRSPAYALWDDSEVKLKLGNVSDEHIAFDGTKIEFLNGASSMGSLTNTTWVLGPAAGDRLELTSTDLRFKTGASTTEAIFDANSITLGSATTMQTVITNSSFLTGDAAGENVYITSAGVYIRSGSTVYTSLEGTALTVGEVGASKSNAYLSSGGLQLRTNTTVKVDLQSDGDFFLGTDTSAAATTTLAIFSTTQTYNGESMGVGDLLLGDNTTGKANLWWDKSAGTLYFRGGTTSGAHITTAGGLVATTGTIGGWTIGAAELTGTSVVLGSPGYATFGSGNNILKIDTTDPSGLFWIGHSDYSSAPVRVTAQGVLTAEGASITTTNTGLHILDTNASHDLIIAPGSDLTADRTLTLTTGDAARTITLSGNPTLADWFDQSVKTTATPTFAQVNVDNLRLDGNTLSSVSGAVTVAPLAGQNLNVSLSTTGDFVVNTSQFYVDTSSGFSGIGLTAPEALLHLQTTSGAVTNFLILEGDRNTTDTEVGILFKDRSSVSTGQEVARIWTDRISTTGNFDLVLQAGDQTLGGLQTAGGIRIHGDTGNVLLNTSTNSGFLLDLNGTMRATGAAYLSDIRPVSDSTTAVQVKTSGGTGVIVVDTTNSRIGINKTPGAFDFDVNGELNANGLKAVSGWVSSNWGVGLEATDPSWKFEVSGDSRFTGAINLTEHLRLAETANTPSSLTSSAEGVLYVKGDKLIIAFNDAGTTRYKYLDLTGTGVTWVHTTTAP